MVVSAYASVLSLMRVLENALHPCRCHLLPNPAQIEALQEKLGSLQDFLEVHPSKISEETEDLARKLPDITNEADHVIDDYMVDRIRGGYMDESYVDSHSFCQNIDRVVEQIESVNRKLMVLLKDQKIGIVYRNTSKVHHVPKTSSAALFKDKHNVVGFEKPLLEIMDKLTEQSPNLKVISITGMAGIGKTTLARIVYNDRCIVDNFAVRIWLTISQDYNRYEILEGLINDGVLGDRKNIASGESAFFELGESLYQRLSGRKYLIVMDDVWSTLAWDDLRTFFPNNGNGSRIVVTTRLSNVASSVGSKNVYSMDFLDEDNSWDLFSKRAFARGGQFSELTEIGKRIAESCRGLPLSLVVIGGLLANSDMRREYWELVSENVNSFANSENDENCLKILSLSYNYLPVHLKPCFLYMGVFPEDSDILVSELLKLWAAEGFLRPLKDTTWEEVALRYLKDLIDRNIIGIRRRGSRGNIKSCGIHDLLRDLCVREFQKERFLSIPRTHQLSTGSHDELCFLCGEYGKHESMNLSEVSLFQQKLTSFVHPLVCNACRTKYPQLIRLRSVRIIDTIEGKHVEIPQTTKSRLVRIFQYGGPAELVSPSPMTLLWNMQTLYIITSLADPIPVSEIWEMPQLRYLHLGRRALSDPCMLAQRETSIDDVTVLENLQTLTYVSDFRCTEEVVKRMPNLKKLGLLYNTRGGSEISNWSHFCLYNLLHLHNLESMFLKCCNVQFDIETITFPCSLKKLSLDGCDFTWEDINMVGLLPNLEVLKLQHKSVVGDIWNLIEERFLKLKYLKLAYSKLVLWIADETHFPVLETLVLYHTRKLEMIPFCFGDIVTLQLITLEFATNSLIDSAKEMIDEQQSNGNETLRLHVIEPEIIYHFGGPS